MEQAAPRALDQRRTHRAVLGGRRATDPPLTTREMADWIGSSTDYIRDAIAAGELVACGRVGRAHRATYESFVDFCRRKGFRVPRWRDAGAA